MARHKKRLKVNKLLWPATVILVVLVFVIAAAWYGFNIPAVQSKEPAAEYFSVRGTVLAEYGVEEHNTTDGKYYIINGMGFNITAVEGDAHGVVVYWASGASDEVELLKKGESTWVQVLLTNKIGQYVGPVNGSTFQTKIRVASGEADGEINLTVS
jgi:hypothetical protein